VGWWLDGASICTNAPNSYASLLDSVFAPFSPAPLFRPPPACAISSDAYNLSAHPPLLHLSTPLHPPPPPPPPPRLTAGITRAPVLRLHIAQLRERDVKDRLDIADGDAEEARGPDAGLEGVVCRLAHADEAAVFGHDVAVGVVVDLVAYEGAGNGESVSWRIAIVNRGCAGRRERRMRVGQVGVGCGMVGGRKEGLPDCDIVQ